MKYYNDACEAIYSKGDQDPTRIGYFVVCKNNAAQCCLNSNNFKDALRLCTEILVLDKCNVKALYRRGQSYLKLKNNERALIDFRASFLLDPSNTELESQKKPLPLTAYST